MSWEKQNAHIGSLLQAIQPAVERARKEPGDVVDNAVRENVKRVVAQLNSSEPVLAEKVQAGKLKVVGARYDLDTGKVEIVN